MEITMLKLGEIKPYNKNPRKNDQAVKAVKKSIEEFGFKVPIVVDKDYVIITGHTRYKASKEMGLEEVPCIIASDLSEDKVKAFRLADNRTNEFAEWDLDLLREELGEIEMDLSEFDFDFALDEEEPTEIVEDEVPEVEEVETICKYGEKWQLGNHTLMCGDSTDSAMIKKLMGRAVADLVFTDPPYGMKKESEGVLNDNLNYDDLLEFNKKWIPISFDNLKSNGSWYCWGIDEPLMDIYSEILKPMIKENKITFRNLLTWDKGDAGAGGVSFMGKDGLRSYPVGSEKCLFVMCGVQGFNNNQDNYFEGWEPIRKYLVEEAEKAGLTPQKLKEICGVGMWSHWFGKSQFAFITEEHYKEIQNYYNKKEYDVFKKEYDELKKEYYSTRAYFDNTHDKMTDVWALGRISHAEKEEAGGHATPKPIALCARAIKSSSRENESVLDLFGGSGSTLIACEQLNRKCYMMELDPRYCDVIIKRFETLTGKKAVRIDD